MAWALESGAICGLALLLILAEAAALHFKLRDGVPADVVANMAAGAALIALVGLQLAGRANWLVIAALMSVALVAHVTGLILRLKSRTR